MDPKFENVQNRYPLRPVLDRIIEARTLTSDTKTFFEEFQSHRLAGIAHQFTQRILGRPADETSPIRRGSR